LLTLFNLFIQKLEKILSDDNLILVRTAHHTLGRNKNFILSNHKLLEGEALFFAIYVFLMTNREFLGFGKYKVIIVNGRMKDYTFNLHHNVLIKNDTTFQAYWNKIEENLESIYERGYPVLSIPIIEINVWNMDLYANKKIKITKNALTGTEILFLYEKGSDKISGLKFKKDSLNKKFYSTKATDKSENDKYLSYITPLKAKKSKAISKVINIQDKQKKPFSVMDIETMGLKGQEIPVSISIKTANILKLFVIDHSLLKIDVESAIKELWNNLFEFILLNCNKQVIFVHNLGSFDGFFIYKALSNSFKPEEVSCLIDSHNKFIQISLELKNIKIVFKDSYRVFQVSLKDLCSILSVQGKSSIYKEEYHTISLFNKENSKMLEEFKEYSLQDSNCLYDCINKLQELYIHDYNVDITTILSTSTLSMLIFRTKFLKVKIPVLKRIDDSFIRQGYFGGATDYYKMKAENIYYYDVNSLYPYAMKQPMPYELLRKVKIFENNFNLNNFFGFLKVEVNSSRDIPIPLLPCKYQGKTIYPTGSWTGVYFSEELKAVVTQGYQFKFIEGYEFSKIDLFSDYVNHFYEKKKNSLGAERYISKMHLNQLYGIFGRKHDLLETRNIYLEDLDEFIGTRVIKSIVAINDKIVTLLMHKNITDDLILELNSELDINLTNHYSLVKSNVAIASAVTAYARIHMISFKIDGSCVYTDTDSVFIGNELAGKFLGTDLGLMKDELNGLTIKEGYFLGVKKYGYQYLDENNNLVTKSTFSGIEKNSLTFDEIIKLARGDQLVKEIPVRFYKSFQTLSVSIDSTKVTIRRTLDKALINNLYIPLHLESTNLENKKSWFFNYLKSKFIKYLKHLETKFKS
jgi:DNA polymerase type B, organellar and viral